MVGWLLMSHPLYTVKLFAKAKWEIRENELVHNECEETTDEYVCNPCKKTGGWKQMNYKVYSTAGNIPFVFRQIGNWGLFCTTKND